MDKTSTAGRRRRAAPLLAAGGLAALLAAYLLFMTPEKRAVRHRLGEADAKAAAAVDARLQPVRNLFSAGRDGARGFAKDALSLRGKLSLVAGAFDGSSHRDHLARAFAKNVFTERQLRDAIEASCRAYLDDVDGIDAELLVRLRIDLEDPGRAAAPPPPDLAASPEFVEAYRALAARVASDSRRDLAVDVGREAVNLVGGEIASVIALEAVKAAAAEMGIQAGILGGGASSMVATLGVGLVIALVIDYILDEVLKLAGYDPEERIADAVCASLTRMEDGLLREADWRRHFGWKKDGALRAELNTLCAARAELRRGSIKLLLRERGGK